MSAPATVVPGKPVVRIGGTSYPVLLPSLRDPRLHLATVIVSLQILGQIAFDFRLSIAQILVSLLTCAVLEIGIAFRRQHVILWPASALLTGNGVAFILRVPGTEHGDWWSMHGWWIFAATAAVSLLSKYLIQFRGHHIFNPSNFGLVLCFLLLGPARADPLEFWWGPMSPWLALAVAIIVTGGFAILLRLRLLGIAIGFWVTFVACLAVLAASGHAMTARWHLGPVSDWYFWQVLAFSPEILVFLFFMITDPKTIPEGRTGRRVYAVSIGLLAALLLAPQTTEFASKVAVLSALALVCAARPLLMLLGEAARSRSRLEGALAAGAARRTAGAALLAGGVGFVSMLVIAGAPARSSAGSTIPPAAASNELLAVTVVPTEGIVPLDDRTAQQIARDVVADLQAESDALRLRNPDRATDGASGIRLAAIWRKIDAASGRPVVVPRYRVDRVHVTLEPAEDQDPPTVVARVIGTVAPMTYSGSPPSVTKRGAPVRLARTVELSLARGRYVIGLVRGAATTPAAPSTRSEALGGIELRDVAKQVGLDFAQDAFRFGVTTEPEAMMGAGLCWIDYDDDGWLDLYVVNAYADDDYVRWTENGGLPRSVLFHNVRGRFVDVSRDSGADLQLRGNGCVAADFNRDGNTDLYVTTAGYNAATNGYDALLWGGGDGTFVEGARAAGINEPGWHSGATVGDVNGDGRPDLFVAGYADTNTPVPGSAGGFPSNYAGVRDRLYLNQGLDRNGRSRFREVGKRAGLEAAHVDHGLGAIFADLNRDGRLDLYVANDLDPNRLYLNVARTADPAGLGFRLEERGRAVGVDDPNAGMGIAAADYSLDGREDLFVTNSRRQLHAVYRSATAQQGKAAFADARPHFVAALGTSYTGWGVAWTDLDLDGNLDLVLANGSIPVVNLKKDAQRIQVLENLADEGRPGEFADAGSLVGLPAGQRINGRGLAAADYDNDGDVDIAINSINGRLILLRNTGARGHWLEVKLGAFAPGSEVTVTLPGGRTLVRELHAGSSYLSSEDPRAHFGLGAATRVKDVVVRFPDGHTVRRTGVAADQLLVVAR